VQSMHTRCTGLCGFLQGYVKFNWMGCSFFLIESGVRGLGHRQQSEVLCPQILVGQGQPRHFQNSFCNSLHWIFAQDTNWEWEKDMKKEKEGWNHMAWQSQCLASALALCFKKANLKVGHYTLIWLCVGAILIDRVFRFLYPCYHEPEVFF
jgi:hypothetical protein